MRSDPGSAVEIVSGCCLGVAVASAGGAGCWPLTLEAAVRARRRNAIAMRTRIALAFLLLVLTAASRVSGQQPAPPALATAAPTQQPLTISTAEPGSDLTVYLLTFGWGDAVWERFGHNAIWIRDRARNTDLTYNWGMFDFNQPHFIWRFVTGDTRYWMEPIDLQE